MIREVPLICTYFLIKRIFRITEKAMYKHFLHNINHMIVHLHTLIVSGHSELGSRLKRLELLPTTCKVDMTHKYIKGHKSLADVNIDLKARSISRILALAV